MSTKRVFLNPHFRGSTLRVATRLGVSHSVVCRVAKGKATSERISKALEVEEHRIQRHADHLSARQQTSVVADLTKTHGPKTAPRKRIRTQDQFVIHPFASIASNSDARELFYRQLSLKTGKSIKLCKQVVARTLATRFNHVVCREAWKLLDEVEAKDEATREKVRLLELLDRWVPITEASTMIGMPVRNLASACFAGQFIARDDRNNSEAEVLAASIFPLPSSAILPCSWIYRAQELVIAQARAEVALAVHVAAEESK